MGVRDRAGSRPLTVGLLMARRRLVRRPPTSLTPVNGGRHDAEVQEPCLEGFLHGLLQPEAPGSFSEDGRIGAGPGCVEI
jgi:hypothetical protein